MLVWLGYLLVLVILVFGWLLNLLGLPGLWVMVLGHVAFGAITGWGVYVGWPSFTILLALALIAEAAEFFAGAAGSKKAGGTRRGMAGAIVGGLVGGVVGSFLLPIPIIGTVAGAVVGSFIGAAGIEWLIHPDEWRAVKIGYGAAKGRLLGIILKGSIGLVMGVVSAVSALPIGSAALPKPVGPLPPLLLPASQPATRPATVPASLPTSRKSL
jgi:uncharacterized protein